VVAGTRLPAALDISRKPLTDNELEERANHNMHTSGVATETEMKPGCDSSESTAASFHGYNGVLASSRKRKR
jgi:hypothetical protein